MAAGEYSRACVRLKPAHMEESLILDIHEARMVQEVRVHESTRLMVHLNLLDGILASLRLVLASVIRLRLLFFIW